MPTARPHPIRARRPALTEAQLNRFRERLEALRTETLDEIERLRAGLRLDSAQAEDDGAQHVLALDYPLTAARIDREQGALDALDRALARIAEGTYGVCPATGRAIPLERLEAAPYAEHAVEDEAQA